MSIQFNTNLVLFKNSFVFLDTIEMAYSKAITVKYVTAIGTYDEAELADVLTQIDDGDAKLLYELTRKVHNKLKSTRTETVEGKKLELKKQSKNESS